MFIKKQKCTKCDAYYDQLLDTCPSCGAHNGSSINIQSKNSIYWLDYIKQIIIFCIGFAGYQILSFLLIFVFNGIYTKNELFGLMLINLVAYISVFIALVLTLLKDWNKMLHKIVTKKSILCGVIAGFSLIAISTLLSFLLNLIYQGTNENQQLSVQLIQKYPFFAIAILGFIGPIVEELTYRLGLFSFTSRVNRIFAYVVTILFFSLIHIDFASSDIIAELISLPVYVVGAFILTFTYEKFGLLSSVFCHCINNLFSILMIFVGAAI